MSTELSIGLATLALGCLALYVTRSQAQTEREAAVHSAFVAISEAFIAHPALRPVFYDDEPGSDELPGLEDVETRLRANSVAELLLDTLEMARESRHTRASYEEYTSSVFARSPFVTHWAIAHRDLYPSELIAFAIAADRARTLESRQRAADGHSP